MDPTLTVFAEAPDHYEEIRICRSALLTFILACETCIFVSGAPAPWRANFGASPKSSVVRQRKSLARRPREHLRAVRSVLNRDRHRSEVEDFKRACLHVEQMGEGGYDSREQPFNGLVAAASE